MAADEVVEVISPLFLSPAATWASLDFSNQVIASS
jgi:hypothetical protein